MEETVPLSNEDTGAPPSNGGGLLLLAAVSGQIHNLDLRKRAEPLSAGPVHEVAVEEEVSASPVGPLSPSSSDVVLDSAPTSPRPASPDARALLTRSLSSSSASNSSSTSSAQSLVVPHADSCCSSNRHPQHHLQAASQPFPGIAARRPNILNPHLYNVANPDNDPHVLQGKSCGYTLLADKYVLFDKIEGSNNLHRCFEILSGRQKEFVCKVLPNKPSGQSVLMAHYRVQRSPYINPVIEVVRTETNTYMILPAPQLDLHSYVRSKRRLKENQVKHLFRQIVSAVHDAHNQGIVLRDLKLRKFVFNSESRLDIKLESLEDSIVLEDVTNDMLTDKHGCPAYVSPEILQTSSKYSGRAADMWGLGVMLFTMLIGRYPFHGQEHSVLFAKIRHGQFVLPESVSSRARCLIKCLLRKDPAERLTTADVLIHPWLSRAPASTVVSSSSRDRAKRSGFSGLDSSDQVVPCEPPAKKARGVSKVARKTTHQQQCPQHLMRR